MPSFDITCEVDRNEVKNAANQVRKELQTRFDFKGVQWDMVEEKDSITLSAESEFRLQQILEIVRDKLSRRSVNLKNIEEVAPEISAAGRARQVLRLKEGLNGEVAKKITGAVRASGLKVQPAIEGGKVRISGKKRDDLQAAMTCVRALDLPVAVSFGNFRE